MPFNLPNHVTGGVNTNGDERHGRLSADELTIYFVRDFSSAADIFVATRSTLSGPFGVATPLDGLNGGARDLWPTTTRNGLALVFSSSRGGTTERLYLSTRASVQDGFGAPSLIGDPSQTSDDESPFVSWDASELLWSRSGQLLHASLSGTTLGKGTPYAELDTPSFEVDPVLSADGLTIFWASERADLGSKGWGDMWTARRASTSAPFGDIRNVSELNTKDWESPTWLSEDGCRLYYYSNRAGAALWDVYVASRPK